MTSSRPASRPGTSTASLSPVTRNAMRGNWNCCETPNLTGVIAESGSGWLVVHGHWWTFRTYADLDRFAGVHLRRGGDHRPSPRPRISSMRRAVALIGDENGFTGATSVTFSGFSSVVVAALTTAALMSPFTGYRISRRSTAPTGGAPARSMSAVERLHLPCPFTFQSSHDAFAIYLTPTASAGRGSAARSSIEGSASLRLDVFGTGTTAGRGAVRPVDLQRPGTNQQFPFVPVSAGYGELQAGNSGDDVAVANSSTTAGIAGLTGRSSPDAQEPSVIRRLTATM